MSCGRRSALVVGRKPCVPGRLPTSSSRSESSPLLACSVAWPRTSVTRPCHAAGRVTDIPAPLRWVTRAARAATSMRVVRLGASNGPGVGYAGRMTEINEQLTKYLTDAHSIEEQALAQLRTAPELAGDPELADGYRGHLAETEGHERTMRELLEARGAKPSLTKDVVMTVGGKGFLLFARLQPDTPGKLHAHAFSYEALELSSYELLRRVAERADEPEVAEAAERIGGDERRMIERLEGGFDRAVEASLREGGRDDLRERLRKYLGHAHA